MFEEPGTTADEACICFWVDPARWDYPVPGCADPASQMEPNPDCPVHFPVGG